MKVRVNLSVLAEFEIDSDSEILKIVNDYAQEVDLSINAGSVNDIEYEIVED